MTTNEMIQKANESGYDIAIEGKGKRARYTATNRATGKRLSTTMGMDATMRLIQVETIRANCAALGF
jgi:hypothetical protein